MYIRSFRLPSPTPPPFELIPKVILDSLIISIVAYTVTFSMAKIFAKKHNYKVDATQELYALVRRSSSLCYYRMCVSGDQMVDV